MSEPDRVAPDLWAAPRVGGPYGGWGAPPPPAGTGLAGGGTGGGTAGRSFQPLPELRVALLVALPCVAVGVPIGLLWAALRPRLDPFAVSAAAESALQSQFTADLTLAGLGLGAGLLSGLMAWWLTRRHGVGAVLGLAVGGFAAMVVAEHLGRAATHPGNLRADTQHALGLQHDTLAGNPQQIRDFLDLLSFHLRSPGVLLTYSLAAALVFALLTAVRHRASGAPDPYRLSWDSAAAGSVPAPEPPSGW